MFILALGEFCKTLLQQLDAAVRRVMLWLIAGYQYVLSPWLGGSCRFVPTCSQYAKAVFTSHSAPLAFWLTLRRLVRCHPFCEGGEDMPPDCSVHHQEKHDDKNQTKNQTKN